MPSDAKAIEAAARVLDAFDMGDAFGNEYVMRCATTLVREITAALPRTDAVEREAVLRVVSASCVQVNIDRKASWLVGPEDVVERIRALPSVPACAPHGDVVEREAVLALVEANTNSDVDDWCECRGRMLTAVKALPASPARCEGHSACPKCAPHDDYPDDDGEEGASRVAPSAAPVCGTCGGTRKTYTSSYGMPREWPCPACAPKWTSEEDYDAIAYCGAFLVVWLEGKRDEHGDIGALDEMLLGYAKRLVALRGPACAPSTCAAPAWTEEALARALQDCADLPTYLSVGVCRSLARIALRGPGATGEAR